MLLPPGMNTKLSNKSPSNKVADYRSVGMFAASEVADTIEESGGWGFPQVEEREKNILAWVAKTWA